MITQPLIHETLIGKLDAEKCGDDGFLITDLGADNIDVWKAALDKAIDIVRQHTRPTESAGGEPRQRQWTRSRT